MKRFQLYSNSQVNAMKDYLLNSIEYFLISDCNENYNSVAWGNLMQKTMNDTWS